MTRQAKLLFRRATLPLLVIALPMLFVCCAPRWLDSNRFVYGGLDGKVYLHDLKEGASRALLKAPGAGVAIWPASEQLVVSHITTVDRKPKLQVRIYDLAGNKIHESPIHAITTEKTNQMFLGTWTYVSPGVKHVLTFTMQATAAILYDVNQKTFTEFPETLPVSLVGISDNLIHNQTSPFTPDGKGFVAFKADGSPSLNLYPVGGGKPRPFTGMEHLEQGRNTGPGVRTVVTWRGGKLVMRNQNGLLTIDPTERRVSQQNDDRTKQLVEHAKANEVTVLAELGTDALVQLDKKKRLILWRRGEDDNETVLYDGKPGPLSIAPSPDGAKLLVQPIANGGPMTLVDLKTGKTLATIPQPKAGR